MSGETLAGASVSPDSRVGDLWDTVFATTPLANFQLTFNGNVLGRASLVRDAGVVQGSELLAITIPNMAQEKPAEQSSNYASTNVGKPEHEGLRPAGNAVDGDNLDDDHGDSRVHCVSHTKSDFQAWWEVDLGKECELGKVLVYTRFGCRERLWPCWLLVSSEPMPRGLGSLDGARDLASVSVRVTGPDERGGRL